MEAVKINNFVFTNLRTIEEVQALKAEIAKPEYDGLTDKEILEALVTRPQVANPVPAAKVPDPAKMNAIAMLSKLTDEELAKIPEDSLQRVGDDIAYQNIAELMMACRVWRVKAYIDQAKCDILEADILATIDDPRHKATVPGDSKLTLALGREVGGLSIEEVIKAREL